MITTRLTRCNSAELNKNSSDGITLIELIIVIFVIGMLTMILVSDFPKIQRQYALSSATYKLSQDLRKTEDMGLSGVPINDQNATPIAVKGYGIYFNRTQSPTKYLIYADVAAGPLAKQYDGDFTTLCSNETGNVISDCIIETVDISNVSQGGNSSLSISNITDYNGGNSYINNGVSINFNPPNPTTTITTNPILNGSIIKINLFNGLTTRTVEVNISGLINVQ